MNMRIFSLLMLAALALACSRGTERDATPARSAAGATTAVPAAANATPAASPPAATYAMTVYKQPTCGCCSKWEDHMRANGFVITSVPVSDLDAVKREHSIAPQFQSCHTGIVDGYIVEGHVPAADVRRLLTEKPKIRGIAAPGMPRGSPGMEGVFRDAYEVVTLEASGSSQLFARH